MKEKKVKITFTEEVLGTASNNPEIHNEFIASKAPDAPSREEEVEALGVDEVIEKDMTVFPKLEDGTPFTWDYQIKGFFKDTCSALKKVSDKKSSISHYENYGTMPTTENAIYLAEALCVPLPYLLGEEYIL